MRTAVLGRASGGLSRTAALLLAGPVALVVAVLLFTPSVDSRANNAQARMNSPGVVISPAGAVYAGGAAPVAAAPMPPPAPVSVPKDAYVDEGERKQLAKLAGVAPLRPSGKEFYVFTDPNCPFCKDLEPTLEAAASGMKPIVIPVAFKDGSRDLAAAALCSSNPAAEWKKLMATGLPPLAKPCAKGFERVEENMRLFQQLRLTATPTIVSPKGLLVSGAVTPDELARILVN
jgi:protein-disulfide isomerase